MLPAKSIYWADPRQSWKRAERQLAGIIPHQSDALQRNRRRSTKSRRHSIRLVMAGQRDESVLKSAAAAQQYQHIWLDTHQTNGRPTARPPHSEKFDIRAVKIAGRGECGASSISVWRNDGVRRFLLRKTPKHVRKLIAFAAVELAILTPRSKRRTPGLL